MVKTKIQDAIEAFVKATLTQKNVPGALSLALSNLSNFPGPPQPWLPPLPE